MGRPAIHRVQEFNGVRYYRRPDGYYQSDHAHGDQYMHRAVWAHHHGPIPDGFEVHHDPDRDKSNNDIGNLQLMERGPHASLHGKDRAAADPAAVAVHMANIRPKASEWHRSEEGRAWHREHAVRVAEGLAVVDQNCVRCGKPYQVKVGKRKVGYCTPYCQTAARKERGDDDETRTCTVCGTDFTIDRYSRTKTCGRACGNESTRRTKARLRSDGG